MKLKMPNGYVVFLGNDLTDYGDRLDIVKKTVLDYNNGQWTDFMNEYWLKEQSVSGTKVNVTKNLLDRVATYLLLGQYDESDVLTKYMQGKIRQIELPVSSTTDSNIPNVFYGEESQYVDGDRSSELNNSAYGEETSRVHEKSVYDKKEVDFEEDTKKDKVRRKKYKQTRAYKLESLRSTPEVKTYRLNPVIVDGKVLKDISGNVVLDVEYITIGGRKGLIMNGEKYTAEWRPVDTENVFEFNGEKWKISESVVAYQVENKAVKTKDGFNEFTNEADMDRVLVLYMPDREQIYFFDEEIEQIDQRMVTKL